MSRPYTAEEVRDQLLQQFRGIARYWANLPDEDKVTGNIRTNLDRCEGVVHSILATLDGCTLTLPGFKLMPTPHPSDRAYHESQDENWYDPETVIEDSLHELFYEPRTKG